MNFMATGTTPFDRVGNDTCDTYLVAGPYAAIPRPDQRLRPDMNGGVDIIVSRIPDAISIPSKALFTLAGRPIVYLSEQGRYRAVEVGVLARNPDEVAISGIPSGSTVALVDVMKQERKK